MLKQKSIRQSQFELLRIFAMLAIVFSHFTYADINFTDNILNNCFCDFASIGGKLGANIFVIISGYFLVNSKGFKWNKFIKIIATTLFYSVLGYFIMCAIEKKAITLSEIISAFTPILSERWWFLTAYVLLYIVHPVLNKIIEISDKKYLRKIIIISIILWSIIPTLTGQNLLSNSFVFFILLYFIGAYINLYAEDFKSESKKYFLIFFTIIFLVFSSIEGMRIIGKHFQYIFEKRYYFTYAQNILQLLSATFCVIAFSKIKVFYNKYINIISSATLGVLLIHDNEYIRSYIWKIYDVLGGSYETNKFILCISACVVIVYVGCTVVELLRIETIEKLFMKFVLFVEQKIKRRRTNA